LLGGLGAAAILVGMFEDRPIPLLTGLVQLAIAAALVWEEVCIEPDD
jgi:hypothetical protein